MGAPVTGGECVFKVNGGTVGTGVVDPTTGIATAPYTAALATDNIEVDYQGVSGQFQPSSGTDAQPNNSQALPTQTAVSCNPDPGTIGQQTTITATVTTTP